MRHIIRKEDAEVLAMLKEISAAIPSSCTGYAKFYAIKKESTKSNDILIHMPMQPVSTLKIEEGGLT